MFKFLSLLTVLFTYYESGNSQTAIDQSINYQSIDEANEPYWNYQNQLFKNEFENHQRKRVIPCLSRQKSHDPNYRRSNVQWIPTFKATITKPEGDDFVSLSLREEDRNGKYNVLSDTHIRDLPISQKVNTPETSTVHTSTTKVDCKPKVTDEAFRRSIKESEQTLDKQEVDLSPSQDEETIPQVDLPKICDECKERNRGFSNSSRRFNVNNGYLIPLLNKTINKTEQKNIFQKDYVRNNIDTNENRNFNNKPEQIIRYGITEMTESSVILMENTRTCYACSSASNPSCWHPNRRTTVKYCHKGHDACVTKTFSSSYGLVLTRDCGSTCDDTSLPGLAPEYKSCSICHHDLCNGAYSVKGHYLLLTIFLSFLVKYYLM